MSRKSPFWFRTLNQIWKQSYAFGSRINLDRDKLISAAKRKTGLSDLGRDFNPEPLDKLLWSMEQEARLSPVGRFISRERLVSLISIRLRAEAFFKKYPEILEQELYPSWIIIGLQRTGTTKLQRLLARDPDHRVIPSWEVINPIPIQPDLYQPEFRPPHSALPDQNPYPHPDDRRIAMARLAIRMLKLMSPGFFAVHPIDIMQPEEDILLLDVSFMSTTPEATMHVPSYAHWLERTDQSEAYAYAVKLLKFLQWIKPGKRWILKSPHHLEFPALIEKHFNQVHYIWPHRDLTESIPSFLSMVTYNRLIFSDHVDESEIRDHWTRKIGYMLEHALSYRAENGNEGKFCDLSYAGLIENSGNELRKIYAMNGGLTTELEDAFSRHEAEHPHRKHGIHRYHMEDFALTRQEIESHTELYLNFIRKLHA